SRRRSSIGACSTRRQANWIGCPGPSRTRRSCSTSANATRSRRTPLTERFGVSGLNGERIDYLRRVDGRDARSGVEIFSRDLGGVSMEQLSTQVRETRRLVNTMETRDLRRGFTLTLLLLLGAAWLISLLPLVLVV